MGETGKTELGLSHGEGSRGGMLGGKSREEDS